MSKRSRQKRMLEASRQRGEQQVSLRASASEGYARPSIASIVLQRIGQIQQVEHVEHGGPLESPKISLPPSTEHKGMPVVGKPEEWPPCPATCDALEWRRSLEARDYYLTAALTDPNGPKPWFSYPKYQWQYSEFVYLTPDMAQSLLEHMPVNRRKHDSWVGSIKRDILSERWLQTHESIAINKLMNMHDGQHRANGIVQAGRGWPIYITWNVPPESIYVCDSGEKRKINEKLALLFPDSKLTTKTAALCRSMMWGLSARGVRYSESEIAEFAVIHQQLIEWVGSRLRGYRSDMQAVIAKALLWWGEAVIGPFVERLKTIQFLGEGDPAKTLYLWLQTAKKEGRRTSYANPIVYYKKTLAAVCACATGKDVEKLFQKKDDIFEWTAGWRVPENAPSGGKVLLTPPQPDVPGDDEAA